MKITTKLLMLGGIVAGAVAYDRKRRVRMPMGAPATNVGTAPIVDAELVGISEVDPQGLTQMGEAVDPEALERAHGKKML
jgi:hypothetical protein